MTILFITIIFGICTVALGIYVIINENKRRKQNEIADKEKKYKEDHIYNVLIPYYISELTKAKTLNDIFHLHKELWNAGVQHPNFGPCEYGMFRTYDITRMNKNEVFLGDINVLWTNSLTKWELYNNDDDVKQIINQYKTHLICNLRYMDKSFKERLLK